MKEKVGIRLLIILVAMFFSIIILGGINKSNASELIGEWNISANDGESNIIASLYDNGSLIISGRGEIIDFEKSDDRGYFDNINEIKNVVVEPGVTSIGRLTFDRCNNIETILLPDGLRKIGEGAFYECKKLKEVNLPESLEELGESVFIRCYQLTNIKIPFGIDKIDYNCFYGCSNLQKIEMTNAVKEIKDRAFYKCGFRNIELPNGLQKIGEEVFKECTNLESIEIPSNVIEIGKGAFSKCSSLKYIDLPNSIEKLEENIFEYCKSIREINNTENITTIGKDAFLNSKINLDVLNDSKFKNVEIPNFIKNYITLNPNSYELVNCEFNDDNAVIINTELFGDNELIINDGNLNGLTIKFSINSTNGFIPEFYGTTNITIKVGDELNLKTSYYRIFAKDYEDGNITRNIQIISNNVNTSREGIYEIEYKIIDSDNNTVRIVVPVHVIENGDRKIQRTLYTLPDASILNDSVFTRGNNHDSQDLGIYLPANKTFKIRQLNKTEKTMYLHLFNDDRIKENSIETVVYGVSDDIVNDLGRVEYTNEELQNIPDDKKDKDTGTVKDSEMYYVKNMNSKLELKEEYIDVINKTNIKYKINYKENQEYQNWDKYNEKSYDSVPVIKTLYGVDEKPVIEVILNDDIKPLDYYTYGDETEEFIDNWNISQNSYAILEGNRTTFLTPIKDLNDLCKSKKDKNIMSSGKNKYRYDDFTNIDQILNYYDNLVETYDNWIGLSNNPSNPYDFNIKSKFFVKADVHGTGGLAYSMSNYTYCTTDTIDTYLHKEGSVWAPFHEFGHGYQGFLKNKELYLGEISNNFFAYYYQKNDMPDEDWLEEEIGDPAKLEKMVNSIRNNTILEENQKSFLEYYPKENGKNEEQETRVNRFRSRLFVYINLLNKLDYELVFPYTYSYCRKLEYEGKKDYISATDIIAKCFSEASGYNVIPYLESWNLTVSEEIKNEIYDKDYPIVYFLNDLVKTDTKIEQLKENLSLPYYYSLVSNTDIENDNLKGEVSLYLNTSELNKLKESNILLKSGSNVVKAVSVNGNNLQVSDIPAGIYEIESSNDKFKINNRYIYVTENETTLLNIESEEIPENPESDNPEPDNPEPDNPQPDNPQPDNPQPDNPQPDNPEPDNPQPDNPQPDNPQPDNPQPDNPEPDNPQPDNPEPDNPEPDNPEPDNPQPDNPEPDNPEPDNPEPDNPEPDNPQPDNPQPDNPEPDNPESENIKQDNQKQEESKNSRQKETELENKKVTVKEQNITSGKKIIPKTGISRLIIPIAIIINIVLGVITYLKYKNLKE